MKFTKVLICNILVLMNMCQQPKKETAQHRQTTQSLQKGITVSIHIKYYLYLPEKYNDQNNWPLILFLHGSGERGNNLSFIKKWGLPKLLDSMSLPFIVISPQCRANKDWDLNELKALLDNLIENYKVDVNRIYLTGLSMGGYATYEMAIRYPQLFAALVPLSAGGRTFRASNISHIPIWAFHGAKDKAVPIKLGQDMIDAVNKEGGNARITVFPEAGHVCWDRVYRDPKLYKWLLLHQKK